MPHTYQPGVLQCKCKSAGSVHQPLQTTTWQHTATASACHEGSTDWTRGPCCSHAEGGRAWGSSQIHGGLTRQGPVLHSELFQKVQTGPWYIPSSCDVFLLPEPCLPCCDAAHRDPHQRPSTWSCPGPAGQPPPRRQSAQAQLAPYTLTQPLR